jgi:hypothetical protein
MLSCHGSIVKIQEEGDPRSLCRYPALWKLPLPQRGVVGEIERDYAA